MKKVLLASLTFTFFLGGSYAQNEQDALRLSQSDFGGTARFSALGGAFGALGGDISTLSTNPGGIGVYRSSEFTFSPSFYGAFSNTEHYGTEGSNNKFNFNFGNIGYVGVIKPVRESNWKSTNLGIGYNRKSNFHSRVSIDGVNENNSLLDVFTDDLNQNGGFDPDQIETNPDFLFGTNLAWLTFLVDTLPGGNGYLNPIGPSTVRQTYNSTTKGSTGETVLSIGGNYANRLYLGGTFGINSVRYVTESTYQEILPESDTFSILNSFIMDQALETRGYGYNAKVGAIYRVHDYVRVGGSFHSPTFYSLTDEWTVDMYSNFDGGFNYEALSPIGENDYSVRTPYRAIGSLAILFGKKGLLSVDYDYTDHSQTKFFGIGGDDDFLAANQSIKNTYQAASNIRIGTEWRVNSVTQLRAGYGHFGNPYKSNQVNDGSYQTYSAGIGFRQESFFIDFAYVLTQRSEKRFLYDWPALAPTETNLSSHSLTTTLGFKF